MSDEDYAELKMGREALNENLLRQVMAEAEEEIEDSEGTDKGSDDDLESEEDEDYIHEKRLELAEEVYYAQFKRGKAGNARG